MKQAQWGFAPRIGIAWSPRPKLTVRAGYGIYYDRGELFSYFSPSAGSGYNGPFGVTLAPPFVEPIRAKGCDLSAPFGTVGAPAPQAIPLVSLAYCPTSPKPLVIRDAGRRAIYFGPFLFGGYDINNKLPYTQNWTLDLQYQPSNNWLFEVAYVGNHGAHEVLPIPFNQPLIATPSESEWSNGQSRSILTVA